MVSIKRPQHATAVCSVCGAERRIVVPLRPGASLPDTVDRECPDCETQRTFSVVSDEW